ncbi:methyl-accepting chemotaxis protein [Rhizobium sp. RU35A]|uniref:Globin-coupled sensor protein n=1 Tax=Rhizobium straminoryzae TaxID=1387186 RepID=A0A549T7F5_9HYPH|nr:MULTISPECIES: globin-coupled sensor protein [Rhizobium]TRL37803.1 globin-coupled sensor protein [Rhizobium straminoryzae]SIQ94539.1 methyl-accepting chemotaxis protein [Rhizobium sp. RU35A]
MSPHEKMQHLKERLDFVGLDEAQRRVLAEMRPMLAGAIGPALDVFYEKAARHPHTAAFFRNPAHVAHAKGRQVQHWDGIASGRYDEAYVDAVSTVGRTHARLGLEPRWYIGGYAMIMEGIIKAVIGSQLKGLFVEKKAKAVEQQLCTVVKAALLDMDYAISVYLDALAAERAKTEAERARAAADQQEALKAIDAALDQLAARDLTAEVHQTLAADFEQIKANYNRSVAELNNAMSDIYGAVDQVRAEVTGISSATDDMAKRAEQQASALEQTAATLEQITSISASTARRTAEVQQIVQASSEETVRSGAVVREAITAMQDIEGSSQKMTQIIGVIDDIAFQTNLLALNAGVEAARAGEQGKGFAVVAQEVRELAQRSAAAAREIKDLIDRSSADVNRGVSLVNRTGEALVTIGERVASINEHINSIAQSAREQSSGINEINTAVRSMDQITQRNAALMEETSASTQNLVAISGSLGELLGRFRTRGQQRHVPAEERPRRRA